MTIFWAKWELGLGLFLTVKHALLSQPEKLFVFTVLEDCSDAEMW